MPFETEKKVIVATALDPGQNGYGVDRGTAGSEPWESTTQSVVGVPRGSSQESLIHFRGTLLSFKGCDTRKLAKSSGDPATAGFGDAATAGSEPWESPAIEATP